MVDISLIDATWMILGTTLYWGMWVFLTPLFIMGMPVPIQYINVFVRWIP